MLAFRFQLTPAQVDFLLVVYSGKYRRMDRSVSLLPEYPHSHFVSIAIKLGEKGLLTHDNSRNPTYLITPQGKAVAEMIIADAKRIAATRFREVTPAKAHNEAKINGKLVKS
jgi:hypothetical protein